MEMVSPSLCSLKFRINRNWSDCTDWKFLIIWIFLFLMFYFLHQNDWTEFSEELVKVFFQNYLLLALLANSLVPKRDASFSKCSCTMHSCYLTPKKRQRTSKIDFWFVFICLWLEILGFFFKQWWVAVQRLSGQGFNAWSVDDRMFYVAWSVVLMDGSWVGANM